MIEEEIQESAERSFQAYRIPLKTFTSFKYLGRVLTAADDVSPAVVGNLNKSRKSWERMTRILGQKGDNPRISGVQDGGPGGASFQVGDVGADPPHETGPGDFSTQGRKVDKMETFKDTGGGGLVIPTTGGINGGGGL